MFWINIFMFLHIQIQLVHRQLCGRGWLCVVLVVKYQYYINRPSFISAWTCGQHVWKIDGDASLNHASYCRCMVWSRLYSEHIILMYILRVVICSWSIMSHVPSCHASKQQWQYWGMCSASQFQCQWLQFHFICVHMTQCHDEINKSCQITFTISPYICSHFPSKHYTLPLLQKLSFQPAFNTFPQLRPDFLRLQIRGTKLHAPAKIVHVLLAQVKWPSV